jgi:uncharacterized protein DUF2125
MHAKMPFRERTGRGRPGDAPTTDRPPRRRRRRRGARVLLGALLPFALVAAGHAALWRWGVGRLEEGFAAWAEARRAGGWRVEHGAPRLGGWPFEATLTLPGFRLLAPGAVLGVPGPDWRAEAVTLRLSPTEPDRLGVEAEGRQGLRLGAAEVPFEADRLRASLPLERREVPRDAVLEAERLRIDPPAGPGPIALRRARLELETRLPAAGAEPAILLRGAAEEVALPPGAAAAALLGPLVQALTFDAALTGPLPPGAFAPGAAAQAEAWRDGGGALEVRSLALRWGPVAGEAVATLALDEALQPAGAGTVRLAGAAEVLDAAAAAGLLAPRPAAMARTALRLLERRPAGGGLPELEVPVTLEERTLVLARFPLLRLPAWSWPSSAAPARAAGGAGAAAEREDGGRRQPGPRGGAGSRD